MNFHFEFAARNPKFVRVNPSNCRVRRATLDDIAQLTTLWQSMHFSIDELARRITEFQVAESADGKLLGAIGLRITERHGLVHSEAFSDFAHAEQLRSSLWDRLHAVATNHGLLRVWTQESAPFWSRCGLLPADAEVLEKLPASWRGSSSRWLTLKLKEDLDAVIALDKEFALFMQSERQRTNRALQQARILKFIATLIAFALLIAVLTGAFLLLRKNPQLLHR